MSANGEAELKFCDYYTQMSYKDFLAYVAAGATGQYIISESEHSS